MARRAKEIKVDLIWEATDNPNAILPWVRATEILMRGKSRLDMQKSIHPVNEVAEMEKGITQMSTEFGPISTLPFANYPNGGRALIGQVKGSNCRHGYGLQFMQKTRQTYCAYCGLDFAASYQNWLQMALDHVVPTRTGTEKCIPAEWLDDCSNKVLSCAACNGFRNRYKLSDADACPATLKGFYDLRDRVFAERKALVTESHERERAFFEQKLWAIPPKP